jgi:DNA gyrase/topoisomerase IV subunit B
MLIIFVKSTIENPSFDSQTKETLNTTSSKFGSKYKIIKDDISYNTNEIEKLGNKKYTFKSKKKSPYMIFG